MPRKIKLSDLQLVVLAHAAKRDDGHVLPLPPSIADDERTATEVAALLKLKLISETPVAASSPHCRAEGNDRIGLVLTDAGRKAINVDTEAAEVGPNNGLVSPNIGPQPDTPTGAAGPSLRPSKRSTVIALLSAPGGATLTEVCAATGWLEHSTRAFLTGLRKRGRRIARERTGGVTRYAVVEQVNAEG